jgi:HEAT repeat protein
MRIRILIAFIFAIVITLLPIPTHTSTLQTRTSSDDAQKTDEFIRRLKDEKLADILTGSLWTLTHDYNDYKHMEEVLLASQRNLEALEKYERGDSSSLKQLGGVKQFKGQLAIWLDDRDQAVRAFAATLLGVSGDKAYAPQLAKLLVRRKGDSDWQIYDRGSAARALGLFQAKEFGKDLVNMLSSSNKNDRLGALHGLAWMGDKEHAQAVAKLQDHDNEGIRETARQALIMLGASELLKGKK